MRLYIDPGTGSMLFAMVVGIIGVAGFFLKGLWVRLRFLLSGGKKAKETEEAIPFVIFSDDKRYWPVFEPVCRELDKRGFDVVYLTASPDDPALDNAYDHVKAEFIGEGNKAFMRLNFLKATILLSTTPGLDVYQWKRSKDVKYYIHMPHMPSELTTYRMFGIDYYDALLLSGQYQIDDCRALEKLRDLPEKECRLVGIPYLDEKAKRLETTAAQPHERTVLVAPSWGSNSLLNRFGNKLIDQLIATGYHIIIRPHPQSFSSEKELVDRLMKEYPTLEWNRDTDNFDVLNRSDIMISDFSGVIFDFSLVFDKPVICAYTDFDKDPYDAWWLETPIWTATAIPRIGQILSDDNLHDLKRMIDDCLTDESYAESRKKVREETWVNRGEGAVTTTNFLIKKYEALTTETDEVAVNETEQETVITDSTMKGAVDTATESVSDPCGLSEEADGNQIETEMAEVDPEDSPKKKRSVGKLAVLAGIGVFLVAAALGQRFFFTQNIEKQHERSDLELMRMAEGVTRILLIKKGAEAEEYWLNANAMMLLPSSFDKPAGYGSGTSRAGGATKDYLDENGVLTLDYDEKTDYTDKIIMVTIDPETEEVAVRWVEGGEAPETLESTD